MKRRIAIKIKSTDNAKFSNDFEPSNEFWQELMRNAEMVGFIERSKKECNFQEIDTIIPTIYIGEV